MDLLPIRGLKGGRGIPYRRGAGRCVYTVSYTHLYAGIAVNNAGSRNPKVVAAVKDQVDDIMHTFNYPYTIPQAPVSYTHLSGSGFTKEALLHGTEQFFMDDTSRNGEAHYGMGLFLSLIHIFNPLPVARKMVLEELEMKQNG